MYKRATQFAMSRLNVIELYTTQQNSQHTIFQNVGKLGFDRLGQVEFDRKVRSTFWPKID